MFLYIFVPGNGSKPDPHENRKHMDIGEAIKQKQFSSAWHKATVNILYTSSWLESENLRLMKPFGISPQQFNVLRILRGQHPKPGSIGLIQERMLDRMSNASRLVEKLRQKKLVDRKECPSDRRQVDVLITKKGLELLQKLDEIIKATQPGKQQLTEAEAEQLSNLLDRFRG